ncbi:prevent-host-death protein [Rathayibacter agropyri]|uniref:prevent-host-death protein n=1 Tax=Rathayibacter agropyri TaxID=1634927 RepID=UPI0015658082|nr:prevent-host-death protein [Rathayibacter agropyri]NRD07854.1 prevent-host-death protein [Rathayibacter agropyri]
MTITATGPSAHTRRSSDLSKHSAQVFAEAEDHPVTVTRRDGEALVLMSQREADARAQLLQLAAQLLTATLDDGGSLEDRMSALFPWMLALSPNGRLTCSRALVDAARASFSTGQPHLAVAELTSWQETASALAAGLGNEQVTWLDTEDLPTADLVERP